MLFVVQLKADLVGFFHSERNFYKFGCMVGCHSDMAYMATVSGNLFLYSSKGITSKFH